MHGEYNVKIVQNDFQISSRAFTFSSGIAVNKISPLKQQVVFSFNTCNMTLDSALCVKAGQRVECCGYYGTVCYNGEVPPTKGTWLGVDWDDPTRGMHNGTYEGVKYFDTRHPTSGSFVRMEKVNLGMSCPAAIRNRYGEVKNDKTAGIDRENLADLQRKWNSSVAEVVGFDKVNKKQSRFEVLEVVCLQEHNVSGPGEQGELLKLCPNIMDLDLSKNWIHSWQSLAGIAVQLRHLKLLNISENQLKIPPQPVEYQDSFQGLKHIIMSRMEYVWSQILDCATMWPFIENLQIVPDILKLLYLFEMSETVYTVTQQYIPEDLDLQKHRCENLKSHNTNFFSVHFNKITTLHTPPDGILQQLKSLDLSGNLINNWREINNLGTLPRLEHLNVCHVGVSEVYFPVCQPDQKTRLFSALKKLNLSENNIHSWESINELNKLLHLEDLRFHENPVLQEESAETSRQLIIARIGNITNLNGIVITGDERKGAEIDYLKKYGAQWATVAKPLDIINHKPVWDIFVQTHPRYALLLDKYGAPEEEEYTVKKTTLNKNLLTVEFFSPDHDGKLYQKKLPPSMQVQKVIGLAQRLFNTGTEIPKLAYISSKTPDIEFPLDKYLQELSFYSVEDGDRISVRW